MSTPPALSPPPGPPRGTPPRRWPLWLGLFIAGALALLTLFAGVAVIAILFLNGLFARHPPPVGDTPPVAQAPTTPPTDTATPAASPAEPEAPPERPRTVGQPPTAERTRTRPERDAAPPDRSPVRVGGAIPQPTKTRDVRPVYPMIAQRARVQGIVIIEAKIDTTGKVGDLRVLRSIPLLDQAALDAVRQWEYEPTRLNGVPVPVIVTVTVNFTLQ